MRFYSLANFRLILNEKTYLILYKLEIKTIDILIYNTLYYWFSRHKINLATKPVHWFNLDKIRRKYAIIWNNWHNFYWIVISRVLLADKSLIIQSLKPVMPVTLTFKSKQLSPIWYSNIYRICIYIIGSDTHKYRIYIMILDIQKLM